MKRLTASSLTHIHTGGRTGAGVALGDQRQGRPLGLKMGCLAGPLFAGWLAGWLACC